MTMNSLQDALNQFKQAQEMIQKEGNIANRIREAAAKARTDEQKDLVNQLAGEFEQGMKDASKGKVRDLSALINKIKNMAENGN